MKHSSIQQELLAAAVEKLPDNGLRAFRAHAFQQFSLSGMPDTSQEDWRYTSLEPAVRLSNAWLGAIAKSNAPVIQRIQELPRQPVESAIRADWLRFVNGQLVDSDLTDGDAKTVDVGAVTSLSDTKELYTGDALSSLNASLLHGATRIRVARGSTASRPIGLLLASDASKVDKVSATRIVIELESNATMDIVESHQTVGASEAFSNVVIEVRLAQGARLNYLRIQECGDEQILTEKFIARLDNDAILDYTSLDLGGALVRNDVAAEISAPGAEIVANGLYLAGGSRHIDNHLRVDHRVGPARSRAEFRGILSGQARGVFNSKAIVHKGADGTDARQSNHNLLLSDKSEIDTKPELEIYADDVKCAHGATIGQLDKSALFYLSSRGLDEDTASRLLTRAFAASVLDRLPVPAAVDYVAARVDHNLNALMNGSV